MSAVLRIAIGQQLAFSLATLMWLIPSFAAAQVEPARAPDVVCQRLMEEYILRVGKIETADIDAAVQLIASRGRNNGYWREVLRQFQRNDTNDNSTPTPRLLEILTKMLQRDGHARWLQSHPEEISAWVPNVSLGAEVVDAVIARARKAEAGRLEPFVIAVAVARDPRSIGFLREIVQVKSEAPNADRGFAPAPPTARIESRFYAAIALAEMGDVAGVEWLVEAPPAGDVDRLPHASAQSGSMLESRVLALNDVIVQKFSTIEEWQDWWAANKATLSKAF
jgi:hypothetical protein